MKLQFSSDQDYQLKAVRSVVNIFEGQPLAKGDFDAWFVEGGDSQNQTSTAYFAKGVGNNLVLNDEQILKNVQAIQEQNGITPSRNLVPSISEDRKADYCRLNFTTEMETGTGKTYTFLRTIYELNKICTFRSKYTTYFGESIPLNPAILFIQN